MPTPFPPIAELATCDACGKRATHAILVPHTTRTGEQGEAWEGTCARCYPSDEGWQSAPLDLVRQAAELAALPLPATRYGTLAEPQDITIEPLPEPAAPRCACGRAGWAEGSSDPRTWEHANIDTCGWCAVSAPAFVLVARKRQERSRLAHAMRIRIRARRTLVAR